MAIGFVQDNYDADLGGGSIATKSLSFLSNVTAGGHIYVAARHGVAGADYDPTLDDNALGNIYNKIGTLYNSGEGNWIGHWHAMNINGGAATVDMNFSPNVDDFLYVYIRESSGVATSNALDGHSERIAFISDTGTDAATATAITTTAANDVVFGSLFTGSITQTTGTGWTQRRDEARGHFQDKAQAVAGSVTATWTISASNLCHFLVAAFKEAVSGGTVYTRTLSDSINVSDSPVRGQTHGRALSDALSLLDAITRGQTHGRVTVDSASLTDSISRYIKAFRLSVCSVEVTDSVISRISGLIVRTLTDTLSVSDSVQRSVSNYRLAIDSMVLTDFVLRTQTHGRTLNDPVDVTDIVARYVKFYRQLTDNVETNDSLIALITYAITAIGFVEMELAQQEPIVMSLEEHQPIELTLGNLS